MAEVADLTNSIKSTVASTLGSNYSEIGYAIDPEENPSKGAAKKYGVLPGSISQESGSGVVGAFTIEQDFSIILTNDFFNSPAGDASKQSQSITLMDLSLNIYKDLINTKAGLPGTVINVTGLSIDDPEYLNDNTVVIKMNFNILYRRNL